MPDNIKKINSRIQMKNATAVDWKKAVNFSPLKGEMIIYSGDPPRLKVGDGTTNVNDLPFTSAAIYVGDTAPTGNYDLWIDTSMDTGDDTVQVVIFTQEEKSKLAGIEAGANKYVLPTAGAELGGVKTTSTVSDATGLTATPIIDGVPYYKEATPNWNENDNTSKNYIDNRPGAFTKTETITLTATAEANKEGDTTTTSLEFAFPDNRMDLIPGETYQVVWDGQTYNWEAKVLYLNLQTRVPTYSTHSSFAIPYYIVCGRDIVGEFETGAKKAQRQGGGSDSDDELPITIISVNGGVVGTEYYLGRLMIESLTELIVGTSYSITITGKFDYKLYSMTREGENVNSVWATGIFDNAALYMANVYTNAELANYTPSWDNLTDRPGAYFNEDERATGTMTASFNGVADTTSDTYEVTYQYLNCSPGEGWLHDFIEGQVYSITWDGVTYSDVVACLESGEGTYIRLGAVWSDSSQTYDFTVWPFSLRIFADRNLIFCVTSSSTVARKIKFSIRGHNAVRIPEYFLDLSGLTTKYVKQEGGSAWALRLGGETKVEDRLLFKGDTGVPSGGSAVSNVTIGEIRAESQKGTSTNGSILRLVSRRNIWDANDTKWTNSIEACLCVSTIAETPADSLYLEWCNPGNTTETYKIFHSGTTVPITSGGTGATTAAGALTALGAFPISGGTLTGAAFAGADAQKTLSTSQLRNITISTTDLVEGESTLAEGEIYLVYDGGEA